MWYIFFFLFFVIYTCTMDFVLIMHCVCKILKQKLWFFFDLKYTILVFSTKMFIMNLLQTKALKLFRRLQVNYILRLLRRWLICVKNEVKSNEKGILRVSTPRWQTTWSWTSTIKSKVAEAIFSYFLFEKEEDNMH